MTSTICRICASRAEINGLSYLATRSAKGVTDGRRNGTLWEHCMRAAHNCDDFDALLDVARTRNADFLPPLTDSEVVKTAKSAWDYTQRGENRFGRHRAFFDSGEANYLITSDQDVFVFARLLARGLFDPPVPS